MYVCIYTYIHTYIQTHASSYLLEKYQNQHFVRSREAWFMYHVHMTRRERAWTKCRHTKLRVCLRVCRFYVYACMCACVVTQNACMPRIVAVGEIAVVGGQLRSFLVELWVWICACAQFILRNPQSVSLNVQTCCGSWRQSAGGTTGHKSVKRTSRQTFLLELQHHARTNTGEHCAWSVCMYVSMYVYVYVCMCSASPACSESCPQLVHIANLVSNPTVYNHACLLCVLFMDTVCMYVCHIYICVCVYIYTYIHICIFIHIYVLLSCHWRTAMFLPKMFTLAWPYTLQSLYRSDATTCSKLSMHFKPCNSMFALACAPAFSGAHTPTHTCAGSAIFFEFRHYKAAKSKVSTKCWAFLEREDLKEGHHVLELSVVACFLCFSLSISCVHCFCFWNSLSLNVCMCARDFLFVGVSHSYPVYV